MLPSASKWKEASHTLPHPQPMLDPTHDPFVGNETVDDNIAEWATLAIWNALPDHCSNVSASVANGTVILTGVVHSLKQRRVIVEAVSKVRGVSNVVDRVRLDRSTLRRVRTKSRPALTLEEFPARPMLYVVRHCVLDEASISAAMRQALPMLDEAVSARGAKAIGELIVVYRNRVPGAVTVEIGVPVDLSIDANGPGEPALGQSPSGAMLSRTAVAGLPGLLRREAELVATAQAAGLGAGSFFWQTFSHDQTHPWLGHPEAKVYLPIVPNSATSEIASPEATT
jgi:hypothetical protein